jgi:gamma-polyglutamate biosynthesis protein CapA
MFKRLAFISLSFVLIIQLATLRPSFFVLESYAAGEIGVVMLDVNDYVKDRLSRATLSSVPSTQAHDSIVFTGDVMLGRHVETLLGRYGSAYPFSELQLSQFSKDPAVIGNFESAVSPVHVQTPENVMRFSVAEEYVAAFGENFTHASLANNHSLDYGESGYLNAVTLLQKYGVSVFGHNTVISKDSISYIETMRGKVAIIGINATQRIPEEQEIISVCEAAKRRADFQVVYIHWGDEYAVSHSETQRVLAEVLIKSCADLIVGHHPHVVQDIDLIQGVPVVYSLGNYIFDQYFSDDVTKGLVVVLRLEEEVPFLELVPVSSAQIQSVPTRMNSSESYEFLAEISARSHESLQTSIKNARINLFEPVATSTKMAIMSR